MPNREPTSFEKGPSPAGSGSGVLQMKKVYIVEDESVLRDLYCEYFSIALPEYELVGIASEGREALRACAELQPDLVLLDIQLPEISGLQLLKILKREHPAIKVGFLTGSVCPETIKEAVGGGADGFIEKSEGMDQLKKVMKILFSGQKYFSANVNRQFKLFEVSPLPNAPASC